MRRVKAVPPSDMQESASASAAVSGALVWRPGGDGIEGGEGNKNGVGRRHAWTWSRDASPTHRCLWGVVGVA